MDLHTMKTLKELEDEAKGLLAQHRAGTLTSEQLPRLKALPNEIAAAKAHAAKAAEAEQMLAALDGGHDPRPGAAGVKTGPRLSRAVFAKAALDVAKKMTTTGAGQIEAKSPLGTTYTAPLAGLAVVAATEDLTARNVVGRLTLVERAERHYSYVRQTAVENNAAVVPEGQLKPTSTFRVEQVPAQLHVVAHLSEPVDQMVLEDLPTVAQLVQDTMLRGVLNAVDDQLITGTGVAQLTGLDNTSGVLVVPHTGTPLNTIRRAITALRVNGTVPDTLVLHPSDYEAIETTTLTTGAYLLESGPVNLGAGTLWGVPVVQSTSVAVGQAYALDSKQLTLSTDTQGIRVAASNTSGDDFERNRVRFRVEGRFNLDVLQPSAVARVDLTAA